MRSASTDYLIVGAGATGLAFADTLIAETDAHVTIVDRQGKPGGHWNDAYPFVTLHQPSSFYGVASLEMGSGLKDPVGLNRGLYELASGPEVCGYFDRVMNHRLLASGRVSYHPLSNHLGGGEVESLLSGARTPFTVRRKIVDATWFTPAVPSTHVRGFEVGEGVHVVPPNSLPGLWHRSQGGIVPRRFVVLGAGKTAMDTCIWLLQSGADADAITWVVPRDSWVTNRLTTQNAPEFFNEAIGGQADQMEAMAQASSADDLFLRLEACGAMLRIDRERLPTMFHFATLSEAEVEVLRRIRRVLRLGRARTLAADHMVLEQGRADVEPGSLYVDCTASAVGFRASEPVFQPDRIVVQLLRAPLVAFSAALTAWIEAHHDDDALKNRLCAPVPFPHVAADYPRTVAAALANQFHWNQDEVLRKWIRHCRLDAFGRLTAGADKQDADKQAILARLKASVPAAMANMPRLIANAATPA
ncbi:FAD/NAD(P)-binding protein [uncultured Methylibium sp.]|uniref:NAD(P)-binding protein n=1 Tax=uncultured Methylibium sp. TaxID=381093 RepID=UPI0025D541D4|nr:FAD/NAD(P)-binding protein [uncultured Methylibium sp.]